MDETRLHQLEEKVSRIERLMTLAAEVLAGLIEQIHELQAADRAAPICAVHQRPMVRVTGKHGPFWSCHEKNADGSFCSFRPEPVA